MINKGLIVAKLCQRKAVAVAELSPRCAACAGHDGRSPYSHNDLLCPEDSSGQAQHPVLAGLRGVLPPARGHHQSPGVLPGGSFSGSTPRAQVLRAPGGWGGEGSPPRHRWGPARLTCLPAPSLLLCGIAAVVLQHYEEAEIFFEDACCLEPSSVVAWTLSGTKGSQPVCSGHSCRDERCFSPCCSSPLL